MNPMNLLKETINVLTEHNLTSKDVVWVGNEEVKTNWENFAKIADVEYDHGFGSQQVATDLLIVGKNWWLERHEYDGSEWWEFKQMPQKPKIKVELYRVIGGNWVSLEEMKAYL